MYAVGHLALGYLTGKAAGNFLKVKSNVPLLFLLSVIPDIDLFIPGLNHRGPTHSIIILTLLSSPLLLAYRRKAIPYFTALTQHSLIGDFITGGGTQLLYPLTTAQYGVGIEITSQVNILIEYTLFLASLTIFLKTRDIYNLVKPHPSNLTLSIPITALIIPALTGFPLQIPKEHLIPHITYITIFAASIIVDIKDYTKKIIRHR